MTLATTQTWIVPNGIVGETLNEKKESPVVFCYLPGWLYRYQDTHFCLYLTALTESFIFEMIEACLERVEV